MPVTEYADFGTISNFAQIGLEESLEKTAAIFSQILGSMNKEPLTNNMSYGFILKNISDMPNFALNGNAINFYKLVYSLFY